MKERPLPFSAPMVRAELAGNKTVTRRIVKYDSDLMGLNEFTGMTGTHAHFDAMDDMRDFDVAISCPYGQPGDRLWVREAWRVPISLDDLSGKQIAEKCLEAGYRKPWCPIQFEADGARTSEKDWREFGSHPSTAVPGRYRHGRFMPRWASRITLEITGVRVERMQDISEEDAIAEGIRELPLQEREPGAWWCADPLGNAALHYRTPRCAFSALWDSINAKRGLSWNSNPWVWVVEFKWVTP